MGVTAARGYRSSADLLREDLPSFLPRGIGSTSCNLMLVPTAGVGCSRKPAAQPITARRSTSHRQPLQMRRKGTGRRGLSWAGDQEISAPRCPPASEGLQRPPRGPAMSTVQRASTPRRSLIFTLKMAQGRQPAGAHPTDAAGPGASNARRWRVSGRHGASVTSQALHAPLSRQENRPGRRCEPLGWAWCAAGLLRGGWN